MTTPATPPAPGPDPVTASVVVQMGPLWRVDRPGEPFTGDLAAYAESLTRYLVRNLGRFAEPRGGDLFVAVVLQRGADQAGHEHRSGAYTKPATTDAEV